MPTSRKLKESEAESTRPLRFSSTPSVTRSYAIRFCKRCRGRCPMRRRNAPSSCRVPRQLARRIAEWKRKILHRYSECSRYLNECNFGEGADLFIKAFTNFLERGARSWKNEVCYVIRGESQPEILYTGKPIINHP